MRVPVTLAFSVVLALQGAPVRSLSVDEAVDLALRQNSVLKLTRLKVAESAAKATSARASYFPQLSTEGNYWRMVDRQGVTIPAGIVGVFKDEGPVPAQSIRVEQGGLSLLFTQTTLGQPLTQLIKINQGHRIAQLDSAIAGNNVRKAEIEVAFRTREAFYGLLAARAQRRAAQSQLAYSEERLREAREAVETGKALEVALLGARAGLLEARHSLLAQEGQISDVNLELCDLLGLSLDTVIEPVEPGSVAGEANPLDDFVKTGLQSSAEVREAEYLVEKTRRAITAARAEYIPEVSAFGQHIWQSGVPFLARNNGIVGLKMSWSLFDWGKRGALVSERRAQSAQAQENLRRAKNRVEIDVEKSYRKFERALQMAAVAAEALALRRESARLAGDQVEAGVVTLTKAKEAEAALAKAEADLLAANLGALLARDELDRAAGIARR